MTVIYPRIPGEPAPTITRIDDFTVAVTNGLGTEGDVISFGRTNSSPASTFVVDLPAVASGAAGPSAPNLTYFDPRP